MSAATGSYVGQSSAYMNAAASQVDPSVNSALGDVLGTWSNAYREGMKISKTNQMYGSAIPYMFNLAGDLLINPSTVSPSTFKRMVETDNMIQACMRYNIDSIISKVGPYTHPNKEIQATIRKCQDRLRRGWRTMNRDMLTCLYAGFSNSEMIWDWDDEIGGDIIVDTQPLPQNTIVNRVTPQGSLQVEGIGQYVFNSFYPGFSSLFSYGMGNVFQPLLGGQFTNGKGTGSYMGGCDVDPLGGTDPFASTGDLDYPYRTYMISPIGLVWIPVEKVIKATYYGVTNNVNPYGKSMLRSVYNLWITKYAVWQFMLRALKSKSAPLVALFGEVNAPTGEYDPNDPDAFKRREPDTLVEQLRIAAESLESTNYMVLPGKTPGELVDIKSIPNEANIEVMEKIMRYIDEMIASALFVPRTLFGGGGEGTGSHSLAATHEEVNYQFVMSVREDHVNCLLQEYVKPLLEELFDPEDYDGYLGAFEVAVTSVDEQLKLSQTFAQAIDKGYVFPTDLDDVNHMRKAINFQKMDKLIEAFEQVGTTQANQKDTVEKTKGSSTMSNREVNDETNTPYSHNIS